MEINSVNSVILWFSIFVAVCVALWAYAMIREFNQKFKD